MVTMQANIAEAWDELQAVPSYVERYANNSAHNPFCMDLRCGCHDDLALLQEQAQYVEDGLLTSQEFLRTLSGLQI